MELCKLDSANQARIPPTVCKRLVEGKPNAEINNKKDNACKHLTGDVVNKISAHRNHSLPLPPCCYGNISNSKNKADPKKMNKKK